MLEAVRQFATSVFRRRPKAPEAPAREPPSPLPALPTPARASSEIEGGIDHLKQKLDSILASINEERQFSRRTGTKSNHGLIESLCRQAKRIESRIRTMAAELTASRGEDARASLGLPRSRASKVRVREEMGGTDRSLARAVRSALRHGRFANASERAVFQKIASDLSEGRTEIQLHVLERLGEIKSLAALPVLRAAARHQDEELRMAALRGVLAMRHPATRDILAGALGDPSHRVRVQAVRGLYALDDKFLDHLLCQQLRDPHPQVRRAAATYLGWKKFGSAERQLIACLRDDSNEVRAAVAAALGRCGSDGSVFKLIHALGDREAPVREAAAGALQRILGSAPEVDLSAPDEARAPRVKQLKQWWKAERMRRVIGSEVAATPANSREAAGEKSDASPEHEKLAAATPASVKVDEASAPQDAFDKPEEKAKADEPLAPPSGPAAGSATADAGGLDSFDDGFVPLGDTKEKSP